MHLPCLIALASLCYPLHRSTRPARPARPFLPPSLCLPPQLYRQAICVRRHLCACAPSLAAQSLRSSLPLPSIHSKTCLGRGRRRRRQWTRQRLPLRPLTPRSPRSLRSSQCLRWHMGSSSSSGMLPCPHRHHSIRSPPMVNQQRLDSRSRRMANRWAAVLPWAAMAVRWPTRSLHRCPMVHRHPRQPQAHRALQTTSSTTLHRRPLHLCRRRRPAPLHRLRGRLPRGWQRPLLRRLRMGQRQPSLQRRCPLGCRPAVRCLSTILGASAAWETRRCLSSASSLTLPSMRAKPRAQRTRRAPPHPTRTR